MKIAGDVYAGETPTVVLVDPYDSSRNALAVFLRDSGCEVLEAASGLEGILLLREVVPSIVIVDLWPFFSGALQMLEWLRANQRTRNVPVLIVTSTLSSEYRTRAQKVGCDGFLEKPCAPREVLAEVRHILSSPAARAVASPFAN